MDSQSYRRQRQLRRGLSSTLIWIATITFFVGTLGVIGTLRDGPVIIASSSASDNVEVLADGSLLFNPNRRQPTPTGIGDAQLWFSYQRSERAGPPLFRNWLTREEFDLRITGAKSRVDGSPMALMPEAIKGVDPQVRMWVKNMGVGAPAQGLLAGSGSSRTTFDGRGIAKWWFGLVLWIGVPLVCWRVGERLFPPARVELLRRGLCPECQYSLAGLEGAKCPECGRELSPAELAALGAANST